MDERPYAESKVALTPRAQDALVIRRFTLRQIGASSALTARIGGPSTGWTSNGLEVNGRFALPLR